MYVFWKFTNQSHQQDIKKQNQQKHEGIIKLILEQFNHLSKYWTNNTNI